MIKHPFHHPLYPQPMLITSITYWPCQSTTSKILSTHTFINTVPKPWGGRSMLLNSFKTQTWIWRHEPGILALCFLTTGGLDLLLVLVNLFLIIPSPMTPPVHSCRHSPNLYGKSGSKILQFRFFDWSHNSNPKVPHTANKQQKIIKPLVPNR